MAKSKWEDIKEKLILVTGWCREGATDIMVAKNLGIHISTLMEYKLKYPEFSEALKKGKEVVDFEVENALLAKAKSGDVTAQIFWLKNRKPRVWRDKQDIEHSGDLGINITVKKVKK